MAFRVRVLHSLLFGLAGFSLMLCSFFYATPVTLRYGDPTASAANQLLVSSPPLTQAQQGGGTSDNIGDISASGGVEGSSSPESGGVALSGGGGIAVAPVAVSLRTLETDAAISDNRIGTLTNSSNPGTRQSVQTVGGPVQVQATKQVPASSSSSSAVVAADSDVASAPDVHRTIVENVKETPAVNKSSSCTGGECAAALPPAVITAQQGNNKPNNGAQPAAPESTVAVAAAGAAGAAAVAPPQAGKSKEDGTASRQSVIQRINPKASGGGSSGGASGGSSGGSNVAVPTDFTSRGIITRTLYEAGHDIPNPEICGDDFGASLKLVILITSAPSHADARMAIRQTWGHYDQRKDTAISFMIGATTDEALQRELYKESDMYGDIIQSHFLDSYNNLTLKTISLLEWVDTYCYRVGFILKTDDDMFINVARLEAFIDSHASAKRTIYGRLASKWKPIRNKKSKYYVSTEQYKNALFPDFTTGPAYLMTSDVVHHLYTNALGQTYLKLEDVFTTGIVAQEMKVKRVNVREFLNKRIVLHACHVQKAISIHMVKFHEQFDLWKKLLDGKTKCK